MPIARMSFAIPVGGHKCGSCNKPSEVEIVASIEYPVSREEWDEACVSGYLCMDCLMGDLIDLDPSLLPAMVESVRKITREVKG